MAIIAGKVPTASREPVTRPPKGWRKPIPVRVMLQVIVNQHGKAPNGEPLDAINVGIQFDHRPPLAEREYDAAADDTIPAANDPRYIIAMPAPDHQALSGRDNVRMKKTARIVRGEVAFQDMLRRKVPGQKRKPKGTIPGRQFRKRKGMP